MANLRMGSILCHLFSPAGKPEDSRSGVAKGLQQVDYGCALGALALKPSGFCNVGVNYGHAIYLEGRSISGFDKTGFFGILF